MHKTLTSSAGSFLGGLSEALGAEGVSATMTMERASPLQANAEDKHSCQAVLWPVSLVLWSFRCICTPTCTSKGLFEGRAQMPFCLFPLKASACIWTFGAEPGFGQGLRGSHPPRPFLHAGRQGRLLVSGGPPFTLLSVWGCGLRFLTTPPTPPSKIMVPMLWKGGGWTTF